MFLSTIIFLRNWTCFCFSVPFKVKFQGPDTGRIQTQYFTKRDTKWQKKLKRFGFDSNAEWIYSSRSLPVRELSRPTRHVTSVPAVRIRTQTSLSVLNKSISQEMNWLPHAAQSAGCNVGRSQWRLDQMWHHILMTGFSQRGWREGGGVNTVWATPLDISTGYFFWRVGCLIRSTVATSAGAEWLNDMWPQNGPACANGASALVCFMFQKQWILHFP